ncbi:hypothetical protein BU16DRAFT_566014 [Lophium mytilinum]|uniref:Uncharacterized protein n=1 Tax=Lophium mytilinum TaxID=390894 RepID=A0A6A6QG59_9PEZI|nr:hypothetical protein BU16DRAFT_566014 [Lophium mytilinum]
MFASVVVRETAAEIPKTQETPAETATSLLHPSVPVSPSSATSATSATSTMLLIPPFGASLPSSTQWRRPRIRQGAVSAWAFFVRSSALPWCKSGEEPRPLSSHWPAPRSWSANRTGAPSSLLRLNLRRQSQCADPSKLELLPHASAPPRRQAKSFVLPKQPSPPRPVSPQWPRDVTVKRPDHGL